MANSPLLVFGPRSTTYDFGPWHPLTPRRFGPGIDLLREIGAEPGLAPEPAADDELERCHTAAYVATVRRLSVEPDDAPSAGFASGDNPAFAGMHEAAAAVAGGSIRAMEAILRGDVPHAIHPGGGLHHAMPAAASGFCIYDDPALAIARARLDGHRVLYVDLDVHHGDGVQAIFGADPGVLTVSFHESGRYLFPGTGFPHELGEGDAAGTSINMPLEPAAGEGAWLPIVRSLLPALAAAFGPDVVVSQHGADSHAWDPLAHLRVTTTAMGEAARLVDAVAHRWARGRWLSTGGGGYDAYRVVPRAWALTWLAGAHREPPDKTPADWRSRWEAEAARYGQAPLPERFTDDPNAGLARDAMQDQAEEISLARAAVVREAVLPAIVSAGTDRGWLEPFAPVGDDTAVAAVSASPTVIRSLDAGALERLALADQVVPVAGASAGLKVLQAAVADGARLSVAVAGEVVVGVALSVPSVDGPSDDLVALGVAPALRRAGVARALLDVHLEARAPEGRALRARFGVGERDWTGPLPIELRASIATRLLEAAGFRRVDVNAALATVDRHASAWELPAGGG